MTRILVIDDSPTEMARFREILTKNNLTILEATNGEQGIKMAIDQQPDIVLMDVVMPEMNGFQATRKISRNKVTSHIPVVIVSTKNQETDRVWGKRQGAKEYLTKPIDEAELLQVIHRMKPIADSRIGSPIREKPQTQKPQTQQVFQSEQIKAVPVSPQQVKPQPPVTPRSTTLPTPTQMNPDINESDDNGIYL